MHLPQRYISQIPASAASDNVAVSGLVGWPFAGVVVVEPGLVEGFKVCGWLAFCDAAAAAKHHLHLTLHRTIEVSARSSQAERM
jgi:hypothetical protein